MTCPNCRAEMTAHTIEGHLGTAVTIDLCPSCQLFWFDSGESLKLSPAGVLALFRIIGEHAVATRPGIGNMALCPRCKTHLVLTHDLQRNTKFEYSRCPNAHGRLTTFLNFLREKDFVKPLSPQEIQQLRESVQSVNCSSCGASIDLATQSVCAYCGSPLSMLNMKRAGELVAELRAAAQPTEVDPAWPLRLEREHRNVDAEFASFEHGPGWLTDVANGGLVGAGLSALGKWLSRNA